MAEVLAVRPKDISAEFVAGFQGMTAEPVTVAELNAARSALVDSIVTNMPQAHRQFLVSFESGAPDWTLLDVPRADRLPAVKWRQQNLAKLTRNKRIALVAQLETVLQQPTTPSQFTLFAEPGAPKPKRRKR
jgi:hypothetical protein